MVHEFVDAMHVSNTLSIDATSRGRAVAMAKPSAMCDERYLMKTLLFQKPS